MSGLEADLHWSAPGGGFRLDVAIRLGAERGVLFGASGAGKSTILRLLAGLSRPDAGSVRLGGETLFDASAGINVPLRRRRVGMIFQDDLLFPHLSVAANIRFGLDRWPRAEADGRLDEVARLCGVTPLLDRSPATLSGGERQRVGLARALAPRPRLLLCDEPVSALDLATRDLLVDRLRDIQEAERIPLLYVTHSPAEAVALGDRLSLVQGGQIVDEGPPLDVLARASGVPLAGVGNRFRATVEEQPPGIGETVLRIEGGPRLVVPRLDRPVGAAALVRVRADEIVLARDTIVGLSARNVLAGTVERVIVHGSEAEVLIRTGEVAWVASVVAPALGALGLCGGVSVHMIIKARSCHVAADDGRRP